MTTIFGKNLKFLRERANIEQKELSEMLGYKSSSAVSEWEKGVRTPNIGIISNIATIFKMSVDDLMDQDLNRMAKKRSSGISVSIPLLGTIAAGIPILAEQNIEEYFNLDSKIKADFCLRIQGDSMINVNIMDQDIVFIHKQSDLENGEIGAILIGTNATLKRFYRTDGHVVLQAENPLYEPIILSDGDVRIMGRIVANLRQFK